ncbi:MAG TPA: hypothetical protein VHO29_20185 [Marmoricola sp.]|nr:hypothetical protein [Marmoricola sp.]
MAATIDIEIESGVDNRPLRRHRGYYAGDFSGRPVPVGRGPLDAGEARSDHALTPAPRPAR